MSDVREFQLRMYKPMCMDPVLQYRYKTPGTHYFDPVARDTPDCYTEWKPVQSVFEDFHQDLN